MKEQIKRLPNGPLWTGYDLTKAFVFGIVIGFLIAWI